MSKIVRQGPSTPDQPRKRPPENVLPSLVQSLQPHALKDLIETVGVGDAAEVFVADRFIDWLQTWLDLGDGFTAERLEAMHGPRVILMMMSRRRNTRPTTHCTRCRRNCRQQRERRQVSRSSVSCQGCHCGAAVAARYALCRAEPRPNGRASNGPIARLCQRGIGERKCAAKRACCIAAAKPITADRDTRSGQPEAGAA